MVWVDKHNRIIEFGIEMEDIFYAKNGAGDVTSFWVRATRRPYRLFLSFIVYKDQQLFLN